MTITVHTNEVPSDCDYLTTGKRYEIVGLGKNKAGGFIFNDNRHEIYLHFKNCIHLDRGDWIVEGEEGES